MAGRGTASPVRGCRGNRPGDDQPPDLREEAARLSGGQDQGSRHTEGSQTTIIGVEIREIQ